MNIFNKIKKTQFKHAVISAFFLFSMTGSAYGEEEAGLIVDLYVRSNDGLIFVNLDGSTISFNPANKPYCTKYTNPDGTIQTDENGIEKVHRYWIIKSEESLSGKQQYAMLLAAKLNKKKVHIIGTGDCSRWPNGENINYVILPYEP